MLLLKYRRSSRLFLENFEKSIEIIYVAEMFVFILPNIQGGREISVIIVPDVIYVTRNKKVPTFFLF